MSLCEICRKPMTIGNILTKLGNEIEYEECSEHNVQVVEGFEK